MKRLLKKGASILLTLCMILTLIPQYAYAGGESIVQRTTKLPLGDSSEQFGYRKTDGSLNNSAVGTQEIIDSAEGWEWYPGGDSTQNYAANTLVLKGINLETTNPVAISLPDGATIVLKTGTINVVRSTCSEFSNIIGIDCNGELTLKGEGTLEVQSGESSSYLNTSTAISTAGDLNIEGGTIRAIGQTARYRSIGLSSDGVVKISSGNITAKSGTTMDMNISAAIMGASVIIEDGTVYAQASPDYCNRYSILSNDGDGIETGIVATGMLVRYNIDDNYTGKVERHTEDYKMYYCMVDASEEIGENAFDILIQKAPPGASISEKTISGVAGSKLTGTPTMTISLTGCTFVELANNTDISSWFTNLPDGLIVTLLSVAGDGSSAAIGFSGTPVEASNSVMVINIPRENMSIDEPLTVDTNSNAKFAITGGEPSGPQQRTNSLDLTVTQLSYKASDSADPASADPTSEDITDSVEGWKWYLHGDETKGYGEKTLELSGINLVVNETVAIKMPPGSTIVLADGTTNIAKSTYNGFTTTYGIFGQLGDLTILGGTGILVATGGTSTHNSSFGVSATNTLTINGGNITAVGGISTATFTGAVSGGLCANKIDLVGGTIYAKANTAMNSKAVWSVGYPIKADSMEAFQNLEGDYVESAQVKEITQDTYVYGTSGVIATDLKIIKSIFSGTGTIEDPYQIYTREALEKMAQLVNEQNAKYGNKHYRVMANITLNEHINNDSKVWTPIGKNSMTPFTGVFDGGGHAITGLYIDGSASYAGLFGYLDSGSTVKNIGLKGGQIYASGGDSYAGGIAAYNRGGRIEDCFNTASIGGTQSGGITGYNEMGHIQNSYNKGLVVGIIAGGIVGVNQDAEMTIVNCYNTGSVNAIRNSNSAYAGGITGKNYSGTIKNSYNAGSVSTVSAGAGSVYLGGVYGVSNSSTLINVYWLNSSLTEDTSYGGGNTGSAEARSSVELKAMAQTLNQNAAGLSSEYGNLASWKTDTKNENEGYPLFGAVTNYMLTVSGGGIGSTTSGSTEAGTEVFINAGVKEGYRFNGWASSGGGHFKNSSMSKTKFSMPESDVTITANWKESEPGNLKRTKALDLTTKELWYESQTETTSADPTSEDITDSVEGWKWYLHGDETKGYSAKTLELSGISLEANAAESVKLPVDSSIVLVNETINNIINTYQGRYNTVGIEGNGALVIKGATGVLRVIGGSSTENNSMGIHAQKTLSIESGTIYATGGISLLSFSVGIVSDQNIILSGGTIYANASTAPNPRAIVSPKITDAGMEAFQRKDGSYSQKAQLQDGSYVYGTDKTPATDLKITAIPSLPGPSFGGEGTEANPYQITTKEELKEMAQLVNEQNAKYGDKHYRLMVDIVLNEDLNPSPESWAPIGLNSNQPFSGVFDGGNHSIKGIFINDFTTSYAGLFGYIKNGIVKNVGLKGGEVSALGSNSYAGGIAGYNDGGWIEDCCNTSSITGTQSGGITGYNEMGHIQDSYNTGNVAGFVAGGIAGVNQDAELTIVNCYNTGSVKAMKNNNSVYAGGITGKNYSATIKNSYNAGTVSAIGIGNGQVNLGGVFGRNLLGDLIDVYWLDSALPIGYVDDNTVVGIEAKTSSELKVMAEKLNENAARLSSEYDNLASWIDDTKNENKGYPLFGTVTNYTLTISGGGTGATADGSYAAGTIVPITAGTKEGYTFSGWITAGSGTFENASNAQTTFTMPEANATITANWTSTTGGGTGGGSGGKDKSQEPKGTEILVNGKTQSAGKAETTKDADGKTLTTVTVDSDKLKTILSAEKEGAKVTIPIKDGVNAGEGKLTGEMVKSMEDKSATLVIQKGTSSYTLPAAEININEVSQKLGTNVSLKDISVSVKISEPTNAMAKVVESAETGKGFTIVAPAVDFTITCTYGGKSVNSSSFNSYVERTIAIPEGVDPSKITTGIVVEPSGIIYHVPTRVTVINGKYYAVINSLTNSTYSVVWNPIEFSDMTKHWAKESVNNMGSRMVVTGVGNNSYDPGRNMTRAEFAAIMVRALGLAPDSSASAFSDVKSSSWYSGYIKTAVSYGIIKGYDNGNFGPNDTITREQAMTMLSRAMKVTGLQIDLTDQSISKLIDSYTDSTAISAYAKESVAVCLETGVTAGRGNNTIAPKSFITRAEVAVMAERLLKKSNLI